MKEEATINKAKKESREWGVFEKAKYDRSKNLPFKLVKLYGIVYL